MALLAFLSVVVGLVTGLLGGGGSILTVPLFLYVVGAEPRVAVAAGLLVSAAASAVAAIGHARAGRVAVSTGGGFAVASMVGAFGGGRLAAFVPGSVLLGGLGALMLITAGAMLRGGGDAAPRPARGRVSVVRVGIVGLGVGATTGLFGAGGGFVVVPVLAMLFGLPLRLAIGTSLLVVTINAAAGFVGALGQVAIPVAPVAIAAAAAALGSVAGSSLAPRIAVAALRKGFAWLVLALAVVVLAGRAPAGPRSALVAAASSLPAVALLVFAVSVALASASLVLAARARPRRSVFASPREQEERADRVDLGQAIERG